MPRRSNVQGAKLGWGGGGGSKWLRGQSSHGVQMYKGPEIQWDQIVYRVQMSKGAKCPMERIFIGEKYSRGHISNFHMSNGGSNVLEAKFPRGIRYPEGEVSGPNVREFPML